MNKDPLGKYEQHKDAVAIVVPDIMVFKSTTKKIRDREGHHRMIKHSPHQEDTVLRIQTPNKIT